MGLDAVVFRSLSSMERIYGKNIFYIADASTGELALKPGILIVIPWRNYFAMNVRLGNFAEISSLRDNLMDRLSQSDSIIMTRVLYSVSHCGDVISNNDFGRLRQEISAVRSSEVGVFTKSFIDTLERLIETGESEANPIVFT